MSYGRNRGYNNNGYNNYNNNNGYNNYNNNNGGYNRNNQREQKKKSGCKAGQGRNGAPYVQGWKADKTNGLRSFFAYPYKGTHEVTSKSGRVYHNWMCKVTLSNGTEQLYTCLYEPMTQKVTISNLSFVMNPKGGRGGYVGPYYQRKR